MPGGVTTCQASFGAPGAPFVHPAQTSTVTTAVPRNAHLMRCRLIITTPPSLDQCSGVPEVFVIVRPVSFAHGGHRCPTSRRITSSQLGADPGQLGLHGRRFDHLDERSPAGKMLGDHQSRRRRDPHPNPPLVEVFLGLGVAATELIAQYRNKL